MLTVHKFYSDKYYTNSYFSQVCGVDLQVLNAHEVELLLVLDFKVRCNQKELTWVTNFVSSDINQTDDTAFNTAMHAKLMMIAYSTYQTFS